MHISWNLANILDENVTVQFTEVDCNLLITPE